MARYSMKQLEAATYQIVVVVALHAVDSVSSNISDRILTDRPKIHSKLRSTWQNGRFLR